MSGRVVFSAAACGILTFITTFLIIKRVAWDYQSYWGVLRRRLERRKRFHGYVVERQKWLRNVGVAYMVGREPSVYVYLAVCLLSFTLVVAVGIQLIGTVHTIGDFLILAALGMVGWRIPAMFLKLSDRMDNEAMLGDLHVVYDTLKIQSKSGVYITDILTECYLLVKNERLKDGLRELSNALYAKHDLQSGLRMFHSRFNNVFVDMFVMTMEQSLQSGQTVQMFQDISQQIREVENAIRQREKRRAENKMLAYQLAVYFGILIIVVYAMFVGMLDAFAL